MAAGREEDLLQLSGINLEAIIDDVDVDYSEPLGRGSDATVFSGIWRAPVAVKVLHPLLVERGNDGRENLLQKFGAECNRLRNLRHENVVQFLGVARSRDGTPALVTEKMNTTLERLYQTTRLSLAEQVDMLCDASSGLAFLHSQGVVHRDLTTRNVLLTAAPHRRAKLADVGVARSLHGNRHFLNFGRLTQCPGTLSYMPPEALGKQPRYNQRLDTFSFGVLAMVLVLGREPSSDVIFAPRNVLSADGTEQVIPEIRRRASDFDEISIDHPLRQLIEECLNNDPSKRPSARQLYQRLFIIRRQLRQLFVPPQMTSHCFDCEEKDQRVGQLATELSTTSSQLRQANEAAVEKDRTVAGKCCYL